MTRKMFESLHEGHELKRAPYPGDGLMMMKCVPCNIGFVYARRQAVVVLPSDPDVEVHHGTYADTYRKKGEKHPVQII